MHPGGLFKQGRGQRLMLQALPTGAAEEHSLNGQGRQAQTIPKRARRQVPGCSSDVRANGARATRLGQISWRFNLDTLRCGGAKGADRRSSLQSVERTLQVRPPTRLAFAVSFGGRKAPHLLNLAEGQVPFPSNPLIKKRLADQVPRTTQWSPHRTTPAIVVVLWAGRRKSRSYDFQFS